MAFMYDMPSRLDYDREEDYLKDFELWQFAMDDYCESTGKTYKNYLQTIRNWARRDGKEIDKNKPAANGLVALTLRRKT